MLSSQCSTLSDRQVALNYAHNNGLQYEKTSNEIIMKDPKEYEYVCLPRKKDIYVDGTITHVRTLRTINIYHPI